MIRRLRTGAQGLGSYVLLCVGLAVTVPYLFKRLPFACLALLLMLVVLVMRQDLAERFS